jgi:hypothetical protein
MGEKEEMGERGRCEVVLDEGEHEGGERKHGESLNFCILITPIARNIFP